VHRCRDKKSITLDLRCPEGIELFIRLCAGVDVVVENFAAGTLEAMGLGFPVLQRAHPRLILCSISGFGQEGPYREWRAYDPIIQGMSGLSSVTGYPDRPPVRCGAAVSDTSAALYAVIGILAALQRRMKTGEGEWVDLSMQDGALFLLPDVLEFMWAGIPATRRGNEHIGVVPFDVYQAKDGYVTLCAVTSAHWEGLMRAIGREDLAQDPRFVDLTGRRQHRQEIDTLLQAWIQERSVYDVVTTLQTHQVPSGPQLDLPEVLQDEHLMSRGMVVDLEHPVHGKLNEMKGFGMPIRFVNHPLGFEHPAPALGAHNAEIYGRILGLDMAELHALQARGLI
jgi:CoA:oxalate CoA-transferase